MKVAFKTDPELSVLHAAAAVARREPTVDAKFEQALAAPVAVINERLEIADVDVDRFWRALVAAPPGSDASRVERALLAAGCSELGIDSIAPAVLGRLADARLMIRQRFPKMADQLPLRAGPLRELWEATGPGLLREIGRRTVAKLIPAKTTLHLVQPVLGGDGGLVDQSDAVWIEAVLSHPDPAIPETLRVAWLVARKGLDHGDANRWVAPARMPRAAALALLPIVLAAGEELGVCGADEPAVRRAAEIWYVDQDVDALVRWWNQMRQGELPLPVAIKALDKMLG